MIEVRSFSHSDQDIFDEWLAARLSEGFVVIGHGKVALFSAAGQSMWYATLTRGVCEGRKV